jgi:inorganic triphosphatase YgiF
VAEDALATERDRDPLETELKLSATGPVPVRRLAGLRRLGQMQLGTAQTFLELDRYLDTADGRLAAAKWACRLRSRSRTHLVSLKGPPVAVAGGFEGALHRRPEIEGPASASLDPDSWPPSSARRRLLDMTGGQPLREQLALRQRRTQRSVSDRDGFVGTLSLDCVLVLLREDPAGRLWCVELELERGRAAHREEQAAGMLADLLAVGGLSVEPLTKLERAMALLDHART